MWASSTSPTLLDNEVRVFMPEWCEARPCHYLRLSTIAEAGVLAAEEAVTWLIGAASNSGASNGLIESRILIYERVKDKKGNSILPISPQDILALCNVGFPTGFFMSELFYQRYAAHCMTSSGPCWLLREKNFSAVTLYREEENTVLSIVIIRERIAASSREFILKQCASAEKHWQHPLLPMITVIDFALKDHRMTVNAMLLECDQMHHTLGLTDRYAALNKAYHVPTGSTNLVGSLADLTSRRQETIPFIGNLKIFLKSIEILRESYQYKPKRSRHSPLDLEDILNHQFTLASDIYEKFSEADARFQAFITNLQIRVAQRDTELSLKLARTSAETALAAKRDSSSMKIIAVLTTLFLPGTFVAAILSTPEYSNWPSGTSWRYWAISVPLTVVVMLGLTIWMKCLAVHERKLEAEAKEM